MTVVSLISIACRAESGSTSTSTTALPQFTVVPEGDELESALEIALASYEELRRELGWRILRSTDPYFKHNVLARDTMRRAGGTWLVETYTPEDQVTTVTLAQGPHPSPIDDEPQSEEIGHFQAMVVDEGNYFRVTFPTGERLRGGEIVAEVTGERLETLVEFIETLQFE